MTDITIPPAALEAMARAIHSRYGFSSWEELGEAEEALECARAAFLAMLNAWEGMEVEVARDNSEFIVLPLPQEASDDR